MQCPKGPRTQGIPRSCGRGCVRYGAVLHWATNTDIPTHRPHADQTAAQRGNPDAVCKRRDHWLSGAAVRYFRAAGQSDCAQTAEVKRESWQRQTSGPNPLVLVLMLLRSILVRTSIKWIVIRLSQTCLLDSPGSPQLGCCASGMRTPDSKSLYNGMGLLALHSKILKWVIDEHPEPCRATDGAGLFLSNTPIMGKNRPNCILSISSFWALCPHSAS
jgi:hypothetical protein